MALEDRYKPMFNLLKKYHELPLSKRPQMLPAIELAINNGKMPVLAQRRLEFLVKGEKYVRKTQSGAA